MNNTAKAVYTDTFFNKTLTGGTRLGELYVARLCETYNNQKRTANFGYVADAADNIVLGMDSVSTDATTTDTILANSNDFAAVTEERNMGMRSMLRRIAGGLTQNVGLQMPVDPCREWYSCGSHYEIYLHRLVCVKF
jgi:hypothetical protein